MKGDISRSTFERAKHYTGVRMQQGRVLLDSEWNEQIDVAAHLDASANIDIIGPSGASRINGGFAVVPVPGDLILTPGRMWVEGVLVECDGGEWSAASLDGTDTVELTAWPGHASRYDVGLWLEIDGLLGGNDTTIYGRILSTSSATRIVRFTAPIDTLVDTVQRVRPVYSYATQPHDPEPPNTTVADDMRSLDGTVVPEFVVYLDVWTHHLTAVEEESIREIALGGPDTTTRTQTVWRVRLELGSDDCADIVSPVHDSRLAAQTAPVAEPPNPCIVPSQAGYRGLANQLYRVEVHAEGGDGVASFKWSSDNGAFVFGVEETPVAGQASQLRLHSLGRDDHYGLRANDWVELIDERLEMHGLPGVMARVAITPQQNNRILDLDPATLPPGTDFTDPTNSPIDLTRRPRVRKWAADEVTIDAGDVIPLEAGIEVVFSGTAFRTGEYWLIPARTAINEETGDIEWPRFDNKSVPLPPRGITHTFAALADVMPGDQPGDPWEIEDCRPLFSPLTAPEFYYVSGDGQEAMPDLATDARIQLKYPLKVGVANGGPIANAVVEFEILDGDGLLQNGLKTFETTTDGDGIASTTWAIDAAMAHQLCRARLLKGNGHDPVDLPPIEFNASISVASEVAYDFANCEELSDRNANTVQKALDAFCDILDDPKLHFVGGDGQETRRIAPFLLPEPIQVGVANGIRPVQNQTVRFIFDNGSFVDTLTDANGISALNWNLDPNGQESQSARALLMINGTPTGLPVVFSASFREDAGACTLVLNPGPGWEAPLLALAPNTDAEICFKVGEYPLEAPVVLRNLGKLKFTGADGGTRIVALKSETALRFEHCEEVAIRDLAADALNASVNDEKRLRGTLSFHGCAEVTLQDLHVRCASALSRATACVTIQSELLGGRLSTGGSGPRHVSERLPLPKSLADRVASRPELMAALLMPLNDDPDQPTHAGTVVRVTGCEFIVGHEQVGVLVIDPVVAWIENNVVTAVNQTIPVEQLLRHHSAIEPFRRLFVRGPAVVGPGSVPQSMGPNQERNVQLTLRNANGASFPVVLASLADPRDWAVFARDALPAGIDRPGDVLRHIRGFVHTALLDQPARDKFPSFGVIFNQFGDNIPAQPYAGIIVAGRRVGEVQVAGNVVAGAANGIRVAASPMNVDIKGRVRRTVIVRNMVSISQYVDMRARHGIHAANCDSLLVKDNRIACRRQSQFRHPVEGLHVVGRGFGPMIGVEANHLVNCDIDIRPEAFGGFDNRQWFATDNMTEQGTNTIVQNVRQNPPNVQF